MLSLFQTYVIFWNDCNELDQVWQAENGTNETRQCYRQRKTVNLSIFRIKFLDIQIWSFTLCNCLENIEKSISGTKKNHQWHWFGICEHESISFYYLSNFMRCFTKCFRVMKLVSYYYRFQKINQSTPELLTGFERLSKRLLQKMKTNE